jgi:glutamyl-Q tRNA(Asp) synthetase
LLDLPTPRYAHLPVAVNTQGEKLSKQTLAAPVDAKRPLPVLIRVLDFLSQTLPGDLTDADLDDVWSWAIRNWRAEAVSSVRSIVVPET